MSIVQVTGLKKDLTTGKTVVHALRGVDLTVEDGEYLYVVLKIILSGTGSFLLEIQEPR